MAFRFLTTDPALLRIEFFENITPGDLHDLTREMRAYEATLLAIPDRLVDLSATEARQVTAHDLLLLTQIRRAQVFPNGFRTAIVAPSDASLGFARMFQILNDHPQIEIGVFRETAEAMRWLGRL